MKWTLLNRLNARSSTKLPNRCRLLVEQYGTDFTAVSGIEYFRAFYIEADGYKELITDLARSAEQAKANAEYWWRQRNV